MRTYTFTYDGVTYDANNIAHGTNASKIIRATNGWGGAVTFNYEDTEVTDCQQINTGRCTAPGTSSNYHYFRVKDMVLENGLGTYNRTLYTYLSGPLGNEKDNQFEFLGYSETIITTTTPSAVSTNTTAEKRERYLFIQRGATPTTIDARHGRISTYYAFAPGADNNSYLYYKYSAWATTTLTGSTSFSAVPWVYLDGEWELTYGADANGNRNAFAAAMTRDMSYDSFGNLTQLDEYDAFPPSWPPSSWPAPNTAAATLQRKTVTGYTPNTSAWILNKPNRVVIYDKNNNCLSEVHTFYDNATSYTTAPSKGMPTRHEQPLISCPQNGNAVSNYDQNWAVSTTEYNSLGNPTKQTGYDYYTQGYLGDQSVATEYDSFYKLFPVRQYIPNPLLPDYEVTARYYGVPDSANVTPSLSTDYAYWGTAAEVCEMNDICTRQGYDSFGRPTNRWERIAKGSGWDTTLSTKDTGATIPGYYKLANVHWFYYAPGSLSTSQETFIVTEYHSPRCYGNFVRKHYDGLGQLLLEQRPQQNWTVTRDGCNAGTAGDEIDVNYSYNAQGQPIRVSVPHTGLRADWLTRWDVNWSTVDDTQTNYDALGRPIKTIAPNGEEAQSTYKGRESYTIGIGRNGDPNKLLSWQVTDALGNLREVRSGAISGGTPTLSSTVTLTHTATGNLTRVYNQAIGASTTITYDVAGRKTGMTDSDMGTWSYAYDRLGNLKRQTDARGSTICLFYESILGRLEGKLFQTSTNCTGTSVYSIDYFYDQNFSPSNPSLGQLTSVGYAVGSWYKSLTYNTKGLLATETVGIDGTSTDFTTQYGYDTYMRPITTTYPDGEVVTTSYNSMGLPAKLTSSIEGDLVDGTQNVGVTGDAVTYDEAGRLTQMRLPAGGNLWREQQYYSWTGSTGDSNGRLKSIKVSTPISNGVFSNTGNRLSLTYHYDSFSNLKQLVESTNNYAATTSNFGYDLLNRLTSGFGQNYAYDAAGRLTSFEGNSYTAWDANAVTHVGGTQRYWYDANGNMTTRYTPAGNQTLSWNSENQLSALTGAGANESYLYDVDGKRVRKTSDQNVTYYINDLYEVTTDTTGGVVAAQTLADSSQLQDEELGAPGNSDVQMAMRVVPNNSAQNRTLYLPLLTSSAASATSGEDDTQTLVPLIPLYPEPGIADVAEVESAMSSHQVDSTSLPPAELVAGEPTPDPSGAVEAAEVQTALTVANSGFQSAGNWTAQLSGYYPGTSLWRDNFGTAKGRVHSQDSAHVGYVISNQAYGFLDSSFITVTGSTVYTLSAWLRGEMDSEASEGGWGLYTEIYSSTGHIMTFEAVAGTSLSTGWQSVTGVITTTANTVKLRIRLGFFMNTGWVAFDDVSLKKANSANLVANPDFSAATDWTESPRAEFPGTAFFRSNWGPAAGRNGGYAYVISNQAYGYLESASIPVSTTTSYSLTAWLRGENDSESGEGAWEVRAAYYNITGTFLSEQAVAAEVLAPSTWTQKGGNFTTPGNAATVRVRLLYYFGSGWVAFDDISLKKNATGSNLVPNANFETSGSWSENRQADHPGTSFLRTTWGTAAGHGGGNAYVISNHHYGYLDSDPIAVTAGQRYLVQPFLRGELDPEQSGGCWSVRMQFYTNTLGIGDNGYQDADNQCAFNTKQDGQWHEVGGVFIPPAGTVAIKIRLFSYMNSGWIAFDDVRLRTAPVVTKYYYFNGQRVALRKDGSLAYLHSDHLGSPALSTDLNGNQTGSQQYLAYGARRGGDDITMEDGFTGQKGDGSGLVYMNARYYDPLLGTFVSPDTIVPQPGLASDYNRYLYSRGNPLKFVDPSGHCASQTNKAGDTSRHYDSTCWALVDHILGLWKNDKTGYWDRRWTSQDVFLNSVAPFASNDAEFMNNEINMYNSSDWVQQKNRSIERAEAYERRSRADDPGPDALCKDLTSQKCAEGIAARSGKIAARSGLIATGCSISVVLEPCALAAGTVSAIFGTISLSYTGYQVLQGNATEAELLVGVTGWSMGVGKESMAMGRTVDGVRVIPDKPAWLGSLGDGYGLAADHLINHSPSNGSAQPASVVCNGSIC